MGISETLQVLLANKIIEILPAEGNLVGTSEDSDETSRKALEVLNGAGLNAIWNSFTSKMRPTKKITKEIQEETEAKP